MRHSTNCTHNNYSKNTWQSWVLSPHISHFSRSIHFEKFDEYPSRTFIASKNLYNLSFSVLDNAYNAGGMCHFQSTSLRAKCFMIFRDFRSPLAFMLSFNFPLMSNKVQRILSHMLFFICITSRFWRSKSLLQYGS